jgi:hypothetical protein
VGHAIPRAIGLEWTALLVHIGTPDALDLADRLAAAEPVSALDWPELCVRGRPAGRVARAWSGSAGSW